MNLSLPDELLDELRRVVPPRQRSAFVVEAIRERLALVAQIDAVRESAGTWPNKGRHDPAKRIRAEREAWSKRGLAGEKKRSG
jgi:hypothetical protein